MPAFAFDARGPDGTPQAGVLSAADEGTIAARLRARGWLVLDVRPTDEPDVGTGDATALRWPSLPPASFDVEHALRQISLMLDSGLTLLEALRATGEHARRRSMTRVLDDVARRVERGATFHEAVAAHPDRFEPLARELIRAGEQSGTLDDALVRAAAHMQDRRQLKSSVIQALLYPMIVVLLTVLVAGFMVVNVVPKLEGFLSGSGNRLPAITQMLIDVSHFFQTWGTWIAIGTVASLIALLALDRFPPTRAVLDAIGYRLPVIGRVRTLAATAMFARSLGVLVQNGITLLQALTTVERILPRPVTADLVARARAHVVQGGSLSEGLAGARAIAPIVVKMISIGERSGALDRVLLDAAEFHEAELRAWIKRAGFIIEPLITLIVGGIVGFVYVAFFVAMFSLAGG